MGASPTQAAERTHAEHAANEIPKSSSEGGTFPSALQGYVYFTSTEAEFIGAAVERLIPRDELGPGAVDAGVVYFIDRQLAGAWGSMAKSYRQGPWPEATVQQGYQSPLTPQQVYRAAIAEADRYCMDKFGKPFTGLLPEQQDETLKGFDEGKIEFDAVPAALFFSLLWANTQEGFFSDPVYGGNRDKVGWRLVGFPGVAAAYTQFIERYNVPYVAEPVSIGDVLQGRVETDEHGHPIHALLAPRE
jgi:gluconate 2-dehydrogenase gamma chain